MRQPVGRKMACGQAGSPFISKSLFSLIGSAYLGSATSRRVCVLRPASKAATIGAMKMIGRHLTASATGLIDVTPEMEIARGFTGSEWCSGQWLPGPCSGCPLAPQRGISDRSKAEKSPDWVGAANGSNSGTSKNPCIPRQNTGSTRGFTFSSRKANRPGDSRPRNSRRH